jgi:hypothetical protein
MIMFLEMIHLPLLLMFILGTNFPLKEITSNKGITLHFLVNTVLDIKM